MKFILSGDIRIRFLIASVECCLLFLSKSSTLTTAVEKQLDGCYTRLLRAALNVSWKDHISNKESQFQQVSRYVGCILVATVGEARTRLFANYFFGNQKTADAVRRRGGGRRGGGRGKHPTTTFIDQLNSDTGLTRQDLESACHDQQTEMEQTYQIGAGAPEIDRLR